VFVFFLCGGIAGLAGILCAAPLGLDIQGGKGLSLKARYLWFTGNVTEKLRRWAASRNPLRLIRTCAPVFRKPLRVRRCRVSLAFSTGDAAETALLHGWLCGFCASLCPPVRGGRAIAIRPLFASGPAWSVDCDISLAMPAALFLFRVIRLSIHTKRRTHV
jgi:hypothetical protein